MTVDNLARKDDEGQKPGGRPVASFQQGGVEVAVWDNNGMYNATINKSYKDAAGQWKKTTSFSPDDLAVVAQLTSQAFQEIVRLKSPSSGR